MHAIAVRDRDAGLAGLSLTDVPYPHAAENDVILRIHAAGFTRGELAWEGTWTDRGGRDRTPSVAGQEVSGVVVELARSMSPRTPTRDAMTRPHSCRKTCSISAPSPRGPRRAGAPRPRRRAAPRESAAPRPAPRPGSTPRTRS